MKKSRRVNTQLFHFHLARQAKVGTHGTDLLYFLQSRTSGFEPAIDKVAIISDPGGGVSLDIIVAGIHGSILRIDIGDRDFPILEQSTDSRILFEEYAVDNGVDRIGREAEHSRPFQAGGECELRLPVPARPLWRESKFKQQSARWVAPGTSFSSHLEITW